MLKLIQRLVRDRNGATAIEYGLMAALMAVALIAALAVLSPEVGALTQRALSLLNAA